MKKLMALLAMASFSFIPFRTNAGCTDTFRDTIEVECTSEPGSVTIDDAGYGSITREGNTSSTAYATGTKNSLNRKIVGLAYFSSKT
ncbi:hypothetical protein [uncultured Roseivirga sp.]|uniref:hypothetical protein n=1 Tax=uncultured Roseivirga sp. TaxID=543088 RepID=UPI0032B2B510